MSYPLPGSDQQDLGRSATSSKRLVGPHKLVDYGSGASSTADLGTVELDRMGDAVRVGFSSGATNPKQDSPSPRAKLVSDCPSGARVHCVGGHWLGDWSRESIPPHYRGARLCGNADGLGFRADTLSQHPLAPPARAKHVWRCSLSRFTDHDCRDPDLSFREPDRRWHVEPPLPGDAGVDLRKRKRRTGGRAKFA